MNQDLQSTLDELLKFWQREKLPLNSGISHDNFQTFEQTLDFSFEEDFRRYLTQINGLTDFEWDSALFSFWSTERILKELNDHHPTELICFADYCINLCSFGYHKGKDGIYIHYQTIPGIALVANSFAEFLKIYLTDSNNLLIDV